MSCFIVSKESIDAIVTAIIAQYSSREKALKQYRVMSETGLGIALWRMNHDAYSICYGENSGQFDYTFKPSPCSIVQSLKFLECLLHQCSEGDLQDTELWKQLDLERVKMLKMLVHITAEYQDAKWS